MKNFVLLFLALSSGLFCRAAGQSAQITSDPSPAVSNKSLKVNIQTANMNGEVYCYTWCESVNGQSLTPSWSWDGVHTSKFRMNGSNGNYSFTISDIKEFYGLTDTQLDGLTKLGFIAKTASGTQTDDLFVEVVQGRRDAYSGGEGTAADPFILKTSEDLVSLSATAGDWSSDCFFKMDADIDASTLHSTIGTLSNPFCGTFDGNGYNIKNLSLDNNSIGSSTGLFGALKGATVRNLGVVSANISGATYVGILAGYMESGLIERCYVSGGVAGMSICVGGLVGENVSGEILNCYSGANVFNNSDYATGGIAGKNKGRISNVYSCGSVKGYDYVGGVVGANYGSVRKSLALNSSITSFSNYVARFGGNNNSRNNSMDNYSWDGINPGHDMWTTHGDHAEITDNSALHTLNSFRSLTGWDFDSVWEWKENNGKGYPVLKDISGQTCLLPESYFSVSSAVENIDTAESTIFISDSPIKESIRIKASAGIYRYDLYSLSGRTVLSGVSDGCEEMTIDASSMTPGLYVITVYDTDGNNLIKKIIKD